MIILLAFNISSSQPDPNCDVHMRLLKLRNNHQKQCVKTVVDVRMAVNRCLHFQLWCLAVCAKLINSVIRS